MELINATPLIAFRRSTCVVLRVTKLTTQVSQANPPTPPIRALVGEIKCQHMLRRIGQAITCVVGTVAVFSFASHLTAIFEFCCKQIGIAGADKNIVPLIKK